MRKPMLVAACLMASLAPQVGLACDLKLDMPSSIRWRGALGRGYDVFAPTRHVEPVVIEVQHGGDACNYALSIHPEGDSAALQMGTSRLRFDALRSPSSGDSFLDTYTGTPGPAAIEGRFAHQNDGSRVARHDVYLLIPPGQIVRGGYYTGRLTVRLFELKTNGHPVLKNQRSVYLDAYIVPQINASIGHPDYSAERTVSELQLGKLREGAATSASFFVRSNMSYEFRVRSLNQGRLRHDKTDLTVPYRVSINGRDVSSSTDVRALAFGGPTGPDGNEYRLQVSVPAMPSGLLAGTYRDVLTVTVTSIE